MLRLRYRIGAMRPAEASYGTLEEVGQEGVAAAPRRHRRGTPLMRARAGFPVTKSHVTNCDRRFKPAAAE